MQGRINALRARGRVAERGVGVCQFVVVRGRKVDIDYGDSDI